MAFAPALTEKKHVFSVGTDHRTDFDAGCVDGFTQVLRLGPPTVFLAVADVQVIRPGEKQIAAVRCNIGHPLSCFGIDGSTQVLGLLPFAVHKLSTIDVPFAEPFRHAGAEVDGVIGVH